MKEILLTIFLYWLIGNIYAIATCIYYHMTDPVVFRRDRYKYAEHYNNVDTSERVGYFLKDVVYWPSGLYFRLLGESNEDESEDN